MHVFKAEWYYLEFLGNISQSRRDDSAVFWFWRTDAGLSKGTGWGPIGALNKKCNAPEGVAS